MDLGNLTNVSSSLFLTKAHKRAWSLSSCFYLYKHVFYFKKGKKISTELFIDRMVALYVVKGQIKNIPTKNKAAYLRIILLKTTTHFHVYYGSLQHKRQCKHWKNTWFMSFVCLIFGRDGESGQPLVFTLIDPWMKYNLF